MACACAVGGIVSGFVMCGSGMCGWVPLDWGACLFAIFMALFSAAAVGFLRGPWWVSPVALSVFMAVPVIVCAASQHWLRAVVSAGCIGIAFAGARVFRPEGFRR
jgi:hypothetical protein